MKSFRQFIIEGADPDVSWRQFLKRVKKKAGLGANEDLPKGEAERLKKLFDDQYKRPTTKKGTGISDIEGTDELGPEKRGGRSIKDRENTSRIYDQEKLDQRKLAAQERTRFKKTTKAERSRHIGKPTHISKKHGVKYTPPTKLSKAEQELIDAGKFRRAKKSTNPEKISDVKKKIDDLDARNKKYQSREYSTSTQSKNRYGGKSVQDSRGRWVPDPVDDGKPIKEPGKSARRRTPTKSVEQLKKEIESRTDGRKSNKPPKSTTTRVKGSTFKGNKPLGKPSPVPGGTTPSKPTPVDFQTKRSTPKDFKPRGSSTPKFDKSYNPKAPDSRNPLKTKQKVVKQSDVSKRIKQIYVDYNKKLKAKMQQKLWSGGNPSPDPWKSTDYIDPPKKTEVIDQRKVSKRASKFTKDTNTARIEKLSKGRVKIDYGMPKPEKGTVLRKVDPPKVKTQLSPDTVRSVNPQSNINTPYDKSKATKTFKDMASDSRSKISRKGLVGRSKEYVKNLTNKIKSAFTKSKTKVTTTSTPKSTPKTRGTSKITSSGGKEIRSKLNQISKKPKTKFKLGSTSKITGALTGFDAYQQEREAGSSQGRSVSSGILQGTGSAVGYQVVSNVAKQALKYAPIPRWTKGVLEIGAGLVGSTALQDKTKQAYDYVFPSKTKKTKTTNNNKKLLVPPISKKKSKPVDLSNTTLSLTQYDPSLDRSKSKNK